MPYYRGDYYRGDGFFKKLGRGIKRLGKNLSPLAPLAGILLPAFGAATLVGRGVSAARKVKETGREFRRQAAAMSLQQTDGGMAPAPTLATRSPMPVLVSGLMPAENMKPLPLPARGPGVTIPPTRTQLSTTTAAKRTRQARAGYARRKAKPKVKAQPRRRRRRPSRSR
jgi:hypothetical protein